MARFDRPVWTATLWLSLLLPLACITEEEPPPPLCGEALPERTLDFCEGTTAQLYDPVTESGAALAALDAFPADLLTRKDADSVTGLRIDVTTTTLPRLAGVPEAFGRVLTDLSLLDGWGTTANLYLRFTAPAGPPPSGLPASLNDQTVILAAIVDGEAKRVPFEAHLVDGGTTLMVEPLVPLLPSTRHVLLATRSWLAADGGCIAPSVMLQDILERRSEHPRGCDLSAQFDEALSGLKVAPDDVAAAVVFTTQSIVERSESVAADIETHDFKWKEKAVCAAAGPTFRQCDGVFSAADYRHVREAPESQHGDALWLPPVGKTEPAGWHDHAVRIWLPPTGTGPWPVVIFGHGLGSDRGQGKRLAEVAAPLGFATVAIDAVRHGEHPLGGAKSTIAAVLPFFGISTAPFGFDFIALRDNWRQSAWDKLQLIRLLRQAPDVDGDGQPELDPKRMGYIGVSLGGIMGPEMLALTPHLGFAILSVAGGKVSSIIQHGEQLSAFVTVLKPKGTTDGDIERFFPALQTLIEPGDAANWGRYVLRDRLTAGGPKAPSVLLQMAIDDDIVPNVATRVLARAMAITHAGNVFQPISLLPLAATLPISGNLPDGGTAALFQFDRVTEKVIEGPKKANHSDTPACLEAMAQDGHFIETWLAGKPAEVIDPYVTLKTPPLKP